MERLPKVLVIMSTYNGEKFLKEQIDSILAQTGVDVTLHIFDDCSKDNTQEIAREYEKENNNVFVHVNEKNKNFTYNFLDALFSFKDNQDYDYFAFSDQDDYWLENKLSSAVNKIKETGKCTMYSSNLKVVDSKLEYLGYNMMEDNYKFKHYDIACKNIVTGCTIVFDNAFKNLVTKHYPENIYLHDYWLALVAVYTKTAHYVYDPCPDYILYRQHGSNLIGSDKGVNFIGFLRSLLSKQDPIKSTNNLVKRYYELYQDEINEEDKSIIKRLAGVNKCKNRFVLFFKMKSNYSFKFKIKMVFNKY